MTNYKTTRVSGEIQFKANSYTRKEQILEVNTSDLQRDIDPEVDTVTLRLVFYPENSRPRTKSITVSRDWFGQEVSWG